MKPLFVLFAIFIISALVYRSYLKTWDFRRAGRMAMSCMLVFTAVGHFTFSEGMSMMLPDIIPFKKAVILVTGILEILLAIGLLFKATQRTASVLLIVFFICILPANVYAALNHINIEQANYSGPGPEYLWVRVPMQLLFIGWVYYSAIFPNSPFKVIGTR